MIRIKDLCSILGSAQLIQIVEKPTLLRTDLAAVAYIMQNYEALMDRPISTVAIKCSPAFGGGTEQYLAVYIEQETEKDDEQ